MMKREDTKRHAHRWTEEQLREFIGLYLRAVDTPAIAAHFGVTLAAISKIATRLRKEGVPLPRRTAGHIAGRRNKPWTQEEVEYIVRRRREQATAESIALELDRSFYGVQGMILKLRQEGVEVGMLGNGVRRLWCPDRLKIACAGRGLSLASEQTDLRRADDAQVAELQRAIAA